MSNRRYILTRGQWLAIGLVGFGLTLLFGLSLIWPLFFIIPGGLLLQAALGEDRSAAFLALPGAIILGTGGILLVQSLTGYWESWAFAWTLYGVFFGVGLFLMGQRQRKRKLMKAGRLFTGASSLIFIVLGGLYLLLTQPFAQFMLAAVLIGGGLLLFAQQHLMEEPGPPRVVEPAKPKRKASSAQKAKPRVHHVPLDADDDSAERQSA